VDLIERFVATAPTVARDRVAVLVERAPDYVAELRASVRAHVAESRSHVAAGSTDVDVALAEAIASTLDGLLALDADHAIPERRIVTAAVAYFVDVSEADPDFGSADGLVDDAEVVIAAATVLGHEALAAPVRTALAGRTSAG